MDKQMDGNRYWSDKRIKPPTVVADEFAMVILQALHNEHEKGECEVGQDEPDALCDAVMTLAQIEADTLCDCFNIGSKREGKTLKAFNVDKADVDPDELMTTGDAIVELVENDMTTFDKEDLSNLQGD